LAAPPVSWFEDVSPGCLQLGTRAKRACPVFSLEMRSISSEARPMKREAIHRSYRRSVSPIRTMSPGASCVGRPRRVPFTYVPFVEPMSSTHTPSRRGSTRA
jgi:hypothetical protein